MTQQQSKQEVKPFAAPCRQLAVGAPLGWLRAGWRDYKNSLRVSLTYGLLVFAISASVSLLAWAVGRYVLVLAMLSGFVFLAPLLATGLYSVSRQIQRGETASVRRSLRRMRLALSDAMIFALVLLIVFLVWARAASMVHIFFPANAEQGWVGLMMFLGIGSAVGSIFAVVTFSASAFSLPMIVDKNADMITGCVTSVNAVLRNKPAMLVWAGLIVLLTGIGFATFGLGLVVVVPWLGYATYHAYRETVDAGQWPDSEV